MRGEESPVVYCYDGSEGARRALEIASATLRERQSLVVSVWRPAWIGTAVLSHAALPEDTVEKLDTAAMTRANVLAVEGAALVPRASAHHVRSHGPIWRDLLAFADQHDAGLIVVGSRGLGGLESMVLGSVSHGLVNHSRVPVLIVPPPEV